MTTRIEKSFTAVDSEGNEYTVTQYRKMIDTTTDRSAVRTQTPAALAELRISDGRYVNYKGKGTYEIVDQPMIPITSDDPNAP